MSAVTQAPNADLLLSSLYRMRIELQLSYSGRNLGADLYSAPQRERILRFIVHLASISVTLIAGLGLLTLLLTDGMLLGLNTVGWTVFASVVSAIGLMAQSLNGGLQNQAEIDRYQWYAEEVSRCREEFDVGNAKAKLDALRRLEAASYRELREFMRAHDAARFTT